MVRYISHLLVVLQSVSITVTEDKQRFQRTGNGNKTFKFLQLIYFAVSCLCRLIQRHLSKVCPSITFLHYPVNNQNFLLTRDYICRRHQNPWYDRCLQKNEHLVKHQNRYSTQKNRNTEYEYVWVVSLWPYIPLTHGLVGTKDSY